MMSQKRSIGQLASAAWFEFKAETGPQIRKTIRKATPDERRRYISKMVSLNTKLKTQFSDTMTKMQDRNRLCAESIHRHLREIMRAIENNELSDASDSVEKITAELRKLKHAVAISYSGEE